jgi:hypothetical protein
VSDAHAFNHSVALFKVLVVTLHEGLLGSEHLINLLSVLLKLGILFLQYNLLLVLQLFRLLSILGYFTFCDFAPLLKEFYVVLLGLLLDHLVVLVHLSHQFDVALMHVLHVLLNLHYVGFREFNGH